MSPKHFLNTQDWSRSELDALLTQAALFKRNKLGDQLKGKSIALVFFNPSMRTPPVSSWARSSSVPTQWCCSRARMHGRSSSTSAR